VGDPDARFREDALRVLRAVRFAADLDARIERRTRAALERHAASVALLSAERIRGEWEKILALPRPSVAIEHMAGTGVLAVLFPELDLTRGVTQNRHHAYDVFHHTLASVDAAPRENTIVRWAALFHDLGKPATRVVRHGDATFYDHEFVGAEIADRVLARWRLPHRSRERIAHLVAHHMFDYQPAWSDAVVRRFIRRVGVDDLPDLFDLRIADYVGNGLRAGFPVYLDELRARIAAQIDRRSPLSVADLAVTGEDVMRVLALPSGPDVGRMLRHLLEWVLADPAHNARDELIAEMIRSRDAVLGGESR
jgi:putative nucleotidyltransferase with HDIG domain